MRQCLPLSSSSCHKHCFIISIKAKVLQNTLLDLSLKSLLIVVPVRTSCYFEVQTALQGEMKAARHGSRHFQIIRERFNTIRSLLVEGENGMYTSLI